MVKRWLVDNKDPVKPSIHIISFWLILTSKYFSKEKNMIWARFGGDHCKPLSSCENLFWEWSGTFQMSSVSKKTEWDICVSRVTDLVVGYTNNTGLQSTVAGCECDTATISWYVCYWLVVHNQYFFDNFHYNSNAVLWNGLISLNKNEIFLTGSDE